MEVQPKNWWVYVLESPGSNRTYTGTTTHVARRVEQHNGLRAGGAKATRGGRPWLLFHVEGPMDKVSAHQREYQIKQLSRDEKLRLEAP